MPRNAMDDLFVDGDTERCRIAAVVQECRFCPKLTDAKFCRVVQFASRHTRRNHLSYLAQNITELGPGNTKVFDIRSRLKPDHQVPPVFWQRQHPDPVSYTHLTL